MGTIQNLIITLLIASCFIMSIGIFTGDMYSQYGNVQNVSYIDKSVALAEDVAGMKSDLEDADVGDETAENTMFKGAWKALKRMFATIGLFEGLISETGSLLGLSAAQTVIFYTIILILVIIAIIGTITRTKAP